MLTVRRAALALALTVAAAADAKAPPPCSRACMEHVAMRKCSQRSPRWCVERAILEHRFTGWRAAWMRRIPGCESHWNPYAHNPSGSSGLYQFMPGTWASTPYRNRSIWSAKWQSLAAAWMVTKGRTGEWSCK